jgi:hypothetical protein
MILGPLLWVRRELRQDKVHRHPSSSFQTQSRRPMIVDTRHGKFTMPQAEVASLQKYLQLAPDGVYAADASNLLQTINRQR